MRADILKTELPWQVLINWIPAEDPDVDEISESMAAQHGGYSSIERLSHHASGAAKGGRLEQEVPGVAV